MPPSSSAPTGRHTTPPACNQSKQNTAAAVYTSVNLCGSTVVVVVVVFTLIKSSLQCSPWPQDRLQQLWSGRLPGEENK